MTQSEDALIPEHREYLYNHPQEGTSLGEMSIAGVRFAPDTLFAVFHRLRGVLARRTIRGNFHEFGSVARLSCTLVWPRDAALRARSVVCECKQRYRDRVPHVGERYERPGPGRRPSTVRQTMARTSDCLDPRSCPSTPSFCSPAVREGLSGSRLPRRCGGVDARSSTRVPVPRGARACLGRKRHQPLGAAQAGALTRSLRTRRQDHSRRTNLLNS